MQTDLFAPHAAPQHRRKIGADRRGDRVATGAAPMRRSPPLGGGSAAGIGATHGPGSLRPGSARGSAQIGAAEAVRHALEDRRNIGARSAQTDGELRAAIERAYRDLVEWRGRESERRAALAPYEAAFQEAHDAVARAHLRLGRGPLADPARRAERLALYDARMQAARAAHPFREAWREADRMVREIGKELAALNAELGE